MENRWNKKPTVAIFEAYIRVVYTSIYTLLVLHVLNFCLNTDGFVCVCWNARPKESISMQIRVCLEPK